MHMKCIAGQYSTSCALCRYVFLDVEIMNSVIDVNAGPDSPQNILAEFEDVPVLPLCCPRLITVDGF